MARVSIYVFVLVLRKSFQFLNTNYDISCVLHVNDFVHDKVDSYKFILLIMFIMNRYLTLSNALPASIDRIMWFLSFILLMCITQICEYLNQTCIAFIWPWCIIFLMRCWIWFTDMLLNSLQLLYTHQRYLLVNFFSCSSLSGFDTRVILIS